jgi:serine acetyltransferase
LHGLLQADQARKSHAKKVLECWPGAGIVIGNGTYLNRHTEIVAALSVTIGRDCTIAHDVIIRDTDQHALPGSGMMAKPA